MESSELSIYVNKKLLGDANSPWVLPEDFKTAAKRKIENQKFDWERLKKAEYKSVLEMIEAIVKINETLSKDVRFTQLSLGVETMVFEDKNLI